MIGIPQLDNLTTEQMLQIINGKIKILVKNPKLIQTEIKGYPEPTYFDKTLLPNDTVITLLKMELETRLAFQKIHEHIQDEAKKCGCNKGMELLE